MSVLFALLFSTLSPAAELQPGLYAPGAAPVEAGRASVGGSVSGYAVAFGSSDSFFAGEASWAPSDKTQLALDVVGGYAGGTGGFGSMRTLVYDRPGLRLAPFVMAGAVAPLELEYDAAAISGVALDAGWEKVRFDLSLPILGVATDFEATALMPHGTTLLVLESGVSFFVGERDSLRIGLALIPHLGYRHHEKHWYVEAALSPFLIYNYASVGGGVRF